MHTIDITRLFHAVHVHRGVSAAGPLPAPQPASLERSEQARALATVAHELRNALGPLENAVEVMGRGKAEPQTAERMAGVARRQLRLMARLLADLLDQERLLDGTLELSLAAMSVQELVEQSVSSWSRAATLRRHTLVAVIPQKPLPVLVDPIRMQQVLGNVIANAVRYTAPGGRIEIRVRANEAAATISITDTGMGIEPGELPRIFKVYEQAARARSVSRDGLGLGLAIARRLVQLQGGSLVAASAGRDQGSTFTLTLPLEKKA